MLDFPAHTSRSATGCNIIVGKKHFPSEEFLSSLHDLFLYIPAGVVDFTTLRPTMFFLLAVSYCMLSAKISGKYVHLDGNLIPSFLPLTSAIWCWVTTSTKSFMSTSDLPRGFIYYSMIAAE